MPWTYDANHSVIAFEVAHFGIALIRGRFKSAEVSLDMDEDDLTRSTVETTIDPASIDSGNERRDETLRGEGYLDIAQFPTATFRSQRIEPRGQRYAILGDLTLKGKTHAIELDASFNGAAVDQRGNRRRGFSASATIRRADFGISTTVVEGVPLAGEEVKLLVDLEIVYRE